MVMAILIIPLLTLRMMIQLQLITVEFVDPVLNLYLSPSGPNDDKQYSINDNTCEYYTNEEFNQSFRSKPFSVSKRKKDDRMNEYLNIIKPLNINFPLSLYRRLGLNLVLRKGGFLQPLPLNTFFFNSVFVLFCFVLTAFFEQ